MKNLILTALCILVLISGSYAANKHNSLETKPEPTTQTVPLIVGILIEHPVAEKIYYETGWHMVQAMPMDEGVKTIAQNGWVCDEYGHSFVKGVCKLCGAEN